MRRWFLFSLALLVAGLLCLQQQSRAWWQTVAQISTGGCSQATSFLARTSGLNATHTTAYTNLICGLVTDGVWAKLDVLVVTATQDSTTAVLNLVSASFAATPVGTPTFTADVGYATNGSSSYLDTGYIASTAAGVYVQDSAHIGARISTASTGVAVDGVFDGTRIAQQQYSGSNTGINNLTGFSGPDATAAFWVLTRTASNLSTVYKTGSSFATNAAASTGVVTAKFFFGARNVSGVAANFNGATYTAYTIGSGLSGTDASNYSTRISSYMSAVGAP